MDLALDKLQRLICCKTQTTNQLTSKVIDGTSEDNKAFPCPY